MERDVSIKSGAVIADALGRLGHRTVPVDAFFGYRGEYSAPAEIFTKPAPDLAAEIGSQVPDLEAVKRSRKQDNDSRLGDNVLDVCRAADIVFLALHGSDGEDGRLQAAFDIAGIRYTGCGYLGSALAMNKAASKDLFRAYGIRTPEGRVVNRRDADKSAPCFPCIVKPKASGSSVGTSIVEDASGYGAALEFAFRYGDDAIVERYIRGREVDVGVLAGKALPPIEIRPHTGFFDYKNKYQDGMTDEICPAALPAGVDRELRETAERVFRALYLEVYARMDFIVDEGTGEPYCLEANTLPGMTPASLLPKEAAADGIPFPQLCQRIILESLKRYE